MGGDFRLPKLISELQSLGNGFGVSRKLFIGNGLEIGAQGLS